MIGWHATNGRDSTLIMQLLRDNLTLWTSDMQEGECAMFQIERVSRTDNKEVKDAEEPKEDAPAAPAA